MADELVIAGRKFNSRLLIGTGKYATFEQMREALDKSGAEIVTVAVRRINISDRSKESLLDYIDTDKYTLLPNTAGCYTVEDAIRTARLGREAGLSELVKLEVIGDEKTLFPDNEGLIEAGHDPTADRERLSDDAARLERVYLGLRTSEGVGLPDSSALDREALARAAQAGWMVLVDNRWCATPEGWLRLDELTVALTTSAEGG